MNDPKFDDRSNFIATYANPNYIDNFSSSIYQRFFTLVKKTEAVEVITSATNSVPLSHRQKGKKRRQIDDKKLPRNLIKYAIMET